MRSVATVFVVLLVTVSSFLQAKSPKSNGEETAFVNANVYTGTGERAQALLVRDGRIAQVGLEA